MNINVLLCNLHDCRFYFDGNCSKARGGKDYLYEECSYTAAQEQIEKTKCCANCNHNFCNESDKRECGYNYKNWELRI